MFWRNKNKIAFLYKCISKNTSQSLTLEAATPLCLLLVNYMLFYSIQCIHIAILNKKLTISILNELAYIILS